MPPPLRIGALFAGGGGLDLGLERARLGTMVWACEQKASARAVLAAHWPDARQFDDVCLIPWAIRQRRKRQRGPWREDEAHRIDGLTGGFPCTDLSLAGKGAGLDGERSGLWRHMRSTIGLLRPDVVVIENVSPLLNRGLDRVLADLHAINYGAEWDCVPALSVGAWHIRDRIFIFAYPMEKARGLALDGQLAARVDAAFHRHRGDAGMWHHEPAGLPRVVFKGEMPPAVRIAALELLGNAVVPAVAEVVGECIVNRPHALPSFSPSRMVAMWDGRRREWMEPEIDLFGAASPYSDKLPRAGVMRSGFIYRAKPAAEVSQAKARHRAWSKGLRPAFARILPIPAASEYGSSQNGSNSTRPSAGTPSLSTMARHGTFPTPCASDSAAGPRVPDGRRGASLSHVAILPTPTQGDSKSSGSRNTAGSGAHAGVSLTDAVRGDGGTGRTLPRVEGDGATLDLFATPRASDWRSGHASDETHAKNIRPLCEQVARTADGCDGAGFLSPEWVTWLQGLPPGWTLPILRAWEAAHPAKPAPTP